MPNAGRREESRYRMPAKCYQEGDSTGLVHVGFKAPKERESTRDIEAWEPDVPLSVRGKRLNAYEKRSCALIFAARSWKRRSRYIRMVNTVWTAGEYRSLEPSRCRSVTILPTDREMVRNDRTACIFVRLVSAIDKFFFAIHVYLERAYRVLYNSLRLYNTVEPQPSNESMFE